MHRFGRKLYDIYFGPYSEKLWGVPPSEISSDWAPQRVSVSSIGVVARNLLPFKGKKIKTYARKFLYPIGGIGRIPEQMAERVKHKGGLVCTGTRAVKVARSGFGYVVHTVDADGHRREVSAKKLICSVPLPEFIDMFVPEASADILKAAADLRFRSLRFLNLMLDVPEVTKNTWLYIPEDKFVFFRIQEFTKWCPQNAPKGKEGLTLEVACRKGDRLWSMPDEELLDICLLDLKKMNVDLEGKIRGYFSTYAEHAYPFYSLGYKTSLHKVYRFIEGLEGVVITGRQGLFRYLNMDRALEVGFQAAQALFEGNKHSHLLRDKESKEYLESNLCLSSRK